MKSFHNDVNSMFESHGMSLCSNLGRRNIILSQAQEQFFTEALRESYDDVENDGRTGKADIFIGTLNKELECKLTSRHQSGAINFQTDLGTLAQKGSLDYLYMIADHDFENFAILHFIGLTKDDFRPLSTGARGKVSMYKHKGMKKCNVLIGSVESLNEINLEKLSARVAEIKDTSMLSESSTRAKLDKSIQYWEATPTKYKINLEPV